MELVYCSCGCVQGAVAHPQIRMCAQRSPTCTKVYIDAQLFLFMEVPNIAFLLTCMQDSVFFHPGFVKAEVGLHVINVCQV